MEKITVIIGKAESGKTMKAKEIASSYKKENVTWIDGKNWKHDRPFLYRSCSLNTELIIIDDCDDASHIEGICSSMAEGVKVEKPYEESFYISPKIIIVCSSEISIDDFIQSNAFKRRVSIIKQTSEEVINELSKILDATPKKIEKL
jgi:ABC-type dipeptide/oligopeptide/nickel transport system ATPase component